MAKRFRPRDLQKDSDLEDVRRQLNQIQVEIGRDLDTLFAARKQSEVITATTYAAAFGEVARFAPPSGGTRLILPELNLSALDSRVTAVVEAASGPLSVEVVNGTINGATTLTYATGIGTAEFILTATGWYGWSVSLVAALPLGALVDGSALSVLGRSANSTGVRADIAATPASGAVLRESGNAVGFGTVATAGLAANAVTNAKLAQMAARRVKLRADSAGTGDPVDGTGAQLGEIWRLDTRAIDTTSTGTVTTYAVAAATNVISFNAGIGALTLRGATVPTESGQFVVWENFNTGVNVTFNHEDASAASASERFRCPGGANYVLAASNRIVTLYFGSRHRIIATA
jgi:hypothetical protein